jgi:hypothetical protein
MNIPPLVRGAALVLMLVHGAAGRAQATIDYAGKTPTGLVGNGSSIVKVQPDRFEFVDGGDASGRFSLWVDGERHDLASADAGSSFFPGGVEYRLRVDGVDVEVLHGATRELPYVVAIRVQHATGPVALEFDGRGTPALAAAGRIPIAVHDGAGEIVLAAGQAPPTGSWADWRARFEAPYRQGLVLHTPNRLVDRAVPFNRFLLDLGFNGRLHVCEIFRWRDVWSRDLGSGLAPGAMASGRFEAARTTIEYDLKRHALARPQGLKVTEDPSQGGSAEGVAWLTHAVWRDYLLSGDTEFLRRSAATLRPWVEAWIARDADERGTLIDTTEWMDHSRFFLFPDGARVLYSNALFAGLLEQFAQIETTLGDNAGASRFAALRQRFLRGINSQYWNATRGAYDNLVLWGRNDERSSSDGNVLAILNHVVPAQRVGSVLQAIRATNWRSAGSVTITPPMTHVDAHNDHNYKVWPWWNAAEARARFRNGDVAGGIHLLEKFSETLEDTEYPGLVEELLTPDGVSEGGHAFVTAAGAYQYAIFEGLLGIEILEAGRARLRVAPNVPADWHDWSARVPLPGGELTLTAQQGRLRIDVDDPAVKVIEAPAAARVTGAQHAALSAREAHPVPADLSPPVADAVPAPRPRTAAVFTEPGLPAAEVAGLPARRVSADELLTLDPGKVGALIIAGNALPRHTRTGAEVAPALSRYLDRGGAIVFYGATMQHRQAMGERGGVVDWYEYRPRIDYAPITGWKYRASADDDKVAQDAEQGLRLGWQRDDAGDGWSDVPLPRATDYHPPTNYSGWEWFKARFTLPASARGHAVVLDMGRINERDWTYVNGVLIGSGRGRDEFRNYRIEPHDPVYATLNFGGSNLLAVQVLYAGQAPGLHADVPSVGLERSELAWMPLEGKSDRVLEHPQRHGVISWGAGDFFNSWETSRGAFGFSIAGDGIEFTGPLAGINGLPVATQAAFTDFAIRKPWLFQPLAYTRTQRHLLVPDHGERYPAAARVVNRDTGGEFVLIPRAMAQTPVGPEVLKRLGIQHETSR